MHRLYKLTADGFRPLYRIRFASRGEVIVRQMLAELRRMREAIELIEVQEIATVIAGMRMAVDDATDDALLGVTDEQTEQYRRPLSRLTVEVVRTSRPVSKPKYHRKGSNEPGIVLGA